MEEFIFAFNIFWFFNLTCLISVYFQTKSRIAVLNEVLILIGYYFFFGYAIVKYEPVSWFGYPIVLMFLSVIPRKKILEILIEKAGSWLPLFVFLVEAVLLVFCHCFVLHVFIKVLNY